MAEGDRLRHRARRRGRGGGGRGDAGRAAGHPGHRREPRRRADRADPRARPRVAGREGSADPAAESSTPDSSDTPAGMRIVGRSRPDREGAAAACQVPGEATGRPPLRGASSSRSWRSRSTSVSSRGVSASRPTTRASRWSASVGFRGQDRTVEVGREDPVGEDPVDAVDAVAVADRHPAQRWTPGPSGSGRRGSRSR